LPKCQFTTQYYDYEIRKDVDFYCPEEEPLASGFCIFHDKDYLLQDKMNNEEHKRKVLDRLKHKVNHAISNNEPLLCMDFLLPEFRLSDLNIRNEFTKPVYFSGSQFFGKADFSRANFQEGAFFDEANFQGNAIFLGANFQGKAHFYRANFRGETIFLEANFQEGAFFLGSNFREAAFFNGAKLEGDTSFFYASFQQASFNVANFQGVASFNEAKFEGVALFNDTNFQGGVYSSNSDFYGKTYFSGEFNGKTKFNYVLFEGKEKVTFDIENLSNVSFMNTDITGVRFSDKARWRIKGEGKKVKESKYRYFNSAQR
jgi:uncharacterized protein YjbI with pentapeptide repeats